MTRHGGNWLYSSALSIQDCCHKELGWARRHGSVPQVARLRDGQAEEEPAGVWGKPQHG